MNEIDCKSGQMKNINKNRRRHVNAYIQINMINNIQYVEMRKVASKANFEGENVETRTSSEAETLDKLKKQNICLTKWASFQNDAEDQHINAQTIISKPTKRAKEMEINK